MKALSIRQPWAWLIVHGYKNIENRTWMTRYRGPLLIHAGLELTGRRVPQLEKYEIRIPTMQIRLGGIVGVAEIVDCLEPGSPIESPWYDGQHGFILRNARSLPFTSMKGRLGLFDVNLAEYEQLRAALKEAGYSG